MSQARSKFIIPLPRYNADLQLDKRRAAEASTVKELQSLHAELLELREMLIRRRLPARGLGGEVPTICPQGSRGTKRRAEEVGEVCAEESSEPSERRRPRPIKRARLSRDREVSSISVGLLAESGTAGETHGVEVARGVAAGSGAVADVEVSESSEKASFPASPVHIRGITGKRTWKNWFTRSRTA